MPTKLRHVRIKLPEANAFVSEHHRHHKPVVGHLFSIGAVIGDRLVGVAIIRPSRGPYARRRPDGGSYPPLHGRHQERLQLPLWSLSSSCVRARLPENWNLHPRQRDRRDTQCRRLADDRRNKRWIMVKTVKRKNRQASDTAKDAVRDNPVSERKYITLKTGEEIPADDFWLYAPTWLIMKFGEPV